MPLNYSTLLQRKFTLNDILNASVNPWEYFITYSQKGFNSRVSSLELQQSLDLHQRSAGRGCLCIELKLVGGNWIDDDTRLHQMLCLWGTCGHLLWTYSMSSAALLVKREIKGVDPGLLARIHTDRVCLVVGGASGQSLWGDVLLFFSFLLFCMFLPVGHLVVQEARKSFFRLSA